MTKEQPTVRTVDLASDPDIQPILIPGSWHLEYRHAAGQSASRFLTALRDRAVILGSACPRCSRVRVPPRAFCESCFVRTSDDWVEVGPGGAVESFTITYAEFPNYPPPPHALVYARLDGASTATGNFLRGLDLTNPEAAASALAIGTRVRAVFSDRREARITDFHWELEG